MRFLYTSLLCLGLVIASPWLLFRVLTRERYRRGLSERLAIRLPRRPDARPRLWIHAASAGEMVAAAALAREVEQLAGGYEVVLSSMTTSGVDVAARLLPDATRFVAPLDIGPIAARVFRRVSPRALILVELELWPNWMNVASRRGLPVVVANGRVSATTARRLRWPVARRLLGIDSVRLFAVQNEEMRDRLNTLGVPVDRVAVTGNMKVDVAPPSAADRDAVRTALGIDGDAFVLVAGSTHPGEERAVAEACLALRGGAGGGCELIVAPRHKERLAAAEAELQSAGLASVRLTALRSGAARRPGVAVVVDTMGELAELYRAADVAFVGGTLVAGVGGHNVFEPVQAGVPVVVGPWHKNVRSDVQFLAACDALRVVADAASLRVELERVVADDGGSAADAARLAMERARGAARRTADLVFERCLAPGGAAS